MSGMGNHESDTADQITTDQLSADRSPVAQSLQMPNDLLDDAAAHDAMAGNVTFNLVDASESRPEGDGVSFDQDGVTLSFDDVLSIGTETVGNLHALVVTGDEGDLVRLKSDSDHSWQIAEAIAAPDGFTAYQAVETAFQDHANQAHAGRDHAGGHDIYVLVQQDLHVMLNVERPELA